jgi:hypothetical protein
MEREGLKTELITSFQNDLENDEVETLRSMDLEDLQCN